MLPDDLLAYMFEIGAREAPDPDCGELKSVFSLVVSSVSSRWRLIALHTPALWTNIRICDRLSGVKEWSGLQISRCGGLPLKLQCHLPLGAYGATLFIVAYLDDISEDLLSRCESVTFRHHGFGRDVALGTVLLSSTGGTGPGSLPLLKRFCIERHAVNLQSFLSFLASCPALESLALSRIVWTRSREDGEAPLAGSSLPGFSPAPPMKLESLRAISVSPDTLPVLGAVEVPRLDTLGLKLWPPRLHPQPPVRGRWGIFPHIFRNPLPTKNLSNVRNLHLNLRDDAVAQMILRIICALPSLTAIISLRTTFRDDDEVDDSDRVFPALESIEFEGALWPEHVLRPVVEATAGTVENPGTLKTVIVRLWELEHLERQGREIQNQLAWIGSHVRVATFP